MATIIVTEFVSLDGVIEDPGGSENFRYGGPTGDKKRLTLAESKAVGDDVVILVYRRAK